MLQEAAAATSVELAIEAVSETSEGAEIDSSAETYPTFSAESATVASDGTEVAAVLDESQEGQTINFGQWDYFSKTLHGLNIHKGQKSNEDQLPETLCTEISFPSEDKTDNFIATSIVVSIQIF